MKDDLIWKDFIKGKKKKKIDLTLWLILSTIASISILIYIIN